MESNDIQQYYLRSLISDLTGWNDPQQKLAKAFAQNEFVLYSQSILNLTAESENHPHLEIFVRLIEEERNLTPPGTFLPILEHYNLGPKLDRYVLRRVLVWTRANSRRAGAILQINLCSGTLTDLDFPRFVAAELKATGLRAASLCFEIPDMSQPMAPETLEFAKELKAIGCRIAVRMLEKDHVSFQPIKELAADFVKIGGDLTREIADDKGAGARLRALTRACKAFGIQTVAQHIEDQRTLDMLKPLGVDYAQGYGISRPGPLEAAAKR